MEAALTASALPVDRRCIASEWLAREQFSADCTVVYETAAHHSHLQFKLLERFFACLDVADVEGLGKLFPFGRHYEPEGADLLHQPEPASAYCVRPRITSPLHNGFAINKGDIHSTP